jgi:hypothetical protein
VQGVLLIGLLVAIGLSAWRGIENIQNGANRWTGISLALIALTLLLAALAIQATPTGLRIGVTGKFFGVAWRWRRSCRSAAGTCRRTNCRTGCGNPGAS